MSCQSCRPAVLNAATRPNIFLGSLHLKVKYVQGKKHQMLPLRHLHVSRIFKDFRGIMVPIFPISMAMLDLNSEWTPLSWLLGCEFPRMVTFPCFFFLSYIPRYGGYAHEL